MENVIEAPNTGAVVSSDSVAGTVTPERRAYYDRIGKQNIRAAFGSAEGARAAGAKDAVRSGDVAL